MSEIVKNELDAIKAFETDTEKRRSELTLNELNYISDKQLHKKDGGGTGGGAFVVTIENDRETYSNPSATFAEMLSANEDGKAIILVIKNTQDANGSQYGLRNISTTEAVFQSFYADSNPTYLEAVLITCTSSNVWSSDVVTIIGD